MSYKLLVIDDDVSMCELIKDALGGPGVEVYTTQEPDEALEMVQSVACDVVVTDLELGRVNGLELTEKIVESHPDMPVIVITAYGNMETAIAALRLGAYDFINKPLDLQALEHTVKRAAEHHRLKTEVAELRKEAGGKRVEGFIGESPSIKRIYELISQVAQTDASVLVTGESGTGKELVARALHERSKRREGPFVAINCAAMPANLLESELFGHVKGAFTDAKADHEGLFVRADGGTLLLDEIGEMPVEMQAKLLRVLQESKVRPVGGDKEQSFNVRIVAATNRDIESEVEDGNFREDLFYRINVVRIGVPPLRSRRRDSLILAQHFVGEFAGRLGKPVRGISPEAAQKILEYDWPGNVRELENSIERAVTLTKFEEIGLVDLPEKIRQFESSRMVVSGDDPDEMPTLAEMERRYVERVLKVVGGNKTHAARVLGLDRRTLYRKLDRYERDATSKESQQ